jgi:hypothetical protein
MSRLDAPACEASTSSISAVEGNTLFLGPMTLNDYNVAERDARASNSFPILCAIRGA